MTIIEKLDDLIIQATEERSHYYVKSVCEEAKAALFAAQKEIEELRELLYIYQNTPFAHWHERALKAEERIEKDAAILSRLDDDKLASEIIEEAIHLLPSVVSLYSLMKFLKTYRKRVKEG